jgi:hypothetical protein
MSPKEDRKGRDPACSPLSGIGMLFAQEKRYENIYDDRHGLFTDNPFFPEFFTHNMQI